MRGFIAFLAVALLVGVGAAWWFQWWNVSTGPSDKGKSEVRLTVDKDKVKHDVATAEDKIKEGVHGFKPGHHEKDKTLVQGAPVTGTIRTIAADNRSLTMMNDKNEEVTVRMDAATRVRVGDKEGTLADLRIGDRAAVTYESDKEDRVAKSVTLEKRL